MFIFQCACGNDIYGDEEDDLLAWQCDECGKWYNLFAQEIAPPDEQPEASVWLGDDET